MIEFYSQIKLVHVTAILLSGGLFLLRGLALQSGAAWPGRWAMGGPARYLSYTIDTVLLTAALMLLTVLRLNPFTTPWLAVKMTLLVVYIVLGSLALKRARRPATRLLAFVTALICFGFMYTVARAHHPLGLFYAVCT